MANNRLKIDADTSNLLIYGIVYLLSMDGCYETTLYEKQKSESIKRAMNQIRCDQAAGSPKRFLLSLYIRAGPNLELSTGAFTIPVERQIGERLIPHEFLFLGIFDGEIIIRAPGAGVDVELILFVGRLAL